MPRALFSISGKNKMRKLLAIIICKFGYWVGGLIGKGSSYPGKIALKICPNILSRIKYPPVVIAITGSNGKTSTTEMVSAIIKKAGLRLAYNDKGSNQVEGVTTTVLHYATLGGVMKQDVLLLESDERYAKYSFKYFHPTHYVMTNLYRDQLTRNAHPDWVLADIKRSVFGGECLILNADDPQISRFGYHADNVKWFGLAHTDIDTTEFVGRYHDGYYCPICHAPMEYDYYHYNHIGAYHCTKCDFKRAGADYEVTAVDLEAGRIMIDGKEEISLAFKSIYNVYNILAAYSVCREIGIDSSLISTTLSDYILKNGRFVQFELGAHKGTFLVSKHENSVSYDMSLKYAAGGADIAPASIDSAAGGADDAAAGINNVAGGADDAPVGTDGTLTGSTAEDSIAATGKKCSVMVIVDAISRKYFTSETSWLWDVNFELLNSDKVGKIYLCGKYAHDLMLRFEATDIPAERISLYEDINAACEFLRNNGDEYLYTVTCFSDRMKFLNNVTVRL